MENANTENQNKSVYPTSDDYNKLQNFLKEKKGIEVLWKNVEKNENNSKSNLFDAETAIIDAVDTLTNTLSKFKNSEIGKNEMTKIESEANTNPKLKKEKSLYNKMILIIYSGHEKEGLNFINKFPNWVFNLRSIIANSNHFKRISNFDIYANEIDKANRSKHDFIDISTQDLDTKFANRKNETGKFMKSLKQFGKLFIGKASKTGVEKKVQEFFKRVNAPWRMWWEVVCEKKSKIVS